MFKVQKYRQDEYNEQTQLIKGVVNRDYIFIYKFYDEYAPALYGIIRKIILNKKQAEVVLQKVFIKVFVEVGKFNNKNKRLIIWLHNLARNEAIEALKYIPYHEFKLKTPNSSTRLLKQELYLTPIENSILTLASYRRLSCIQISEILQLPLHLVKNNIQSAYIKLVPNTTPAFN